MKNVTENLIKNIDIRMTCECEKYGDCSIGRQMLADLVKRGSQMCYAAVVKTDLYQI